jgi:hypothetical protein
MHDDNREARVEAAPVFMAWGLPMETREGGFEAATLWLTGGASLLLWTAIALLLTSA